MCLKMRNHTEYLDRYFSAFHVDNVPYSKKIFHEVLKFSDPKAY